MFSYHLRLGFRERVMEVVDISFRLLIQGDKSIIHLIVEEREHIHQRHCIRVYPTHRLAQLIVLGGIGSVEKLDMPTTSNVLQWFCDDNTKVSVRPSGTEPKIKFYIEVKDPSFKCAGCYNRCTAAAMDKIEAIKKSLNLD